MRHEILDLDGAGLRRRCRQLREQFLTPIDPSPRRNTLGYRIEEDGSITGRCYFSAEAAMILRTALDGLAQPGPPPTGSRTPAAPRSAPATP